MPRNGSGVFALPAGSTVANGDTSDASDLNTPLQDIEADMNTPRPVVAGGTGASSASAALVNLGLTATAAELNTLDGITATTAELNILDGVTATASELNILDGATLTVTELNYVDGVTSPIQTQLDAKVAALADPGADSIRFWDDSAGAEAYLTVGTGLTITGTTIEAASGRVLLASKTASSSATLDFTELNNALYSRYVFEFEEILPATDNVSFRCRFSTNGGSSYDAGGTDYVFIAEDFVAAGAGAGDGASGQSYIEITRVNSTSNSAALDGICCEAHLVSAGNASVRTKIYGNGGFMLGGSSPAVMRFYGQRATAQDTDAVRFFFSSGNIASGRIRLYGVV